MSQTTTRLNKTIREETVEQILERMPELEPHIPKISRPLPLVAPSNLLSTLSSLGFDRTASKAQAA